MSDQRYYTLQQIADMLEVNVETVRRWVASGDLEAIYVGRGYRVSQERLNEFLRKRSTKRAE